MSKLVLLLLVIVVLLLYTSCDYSLLQQRRAPARFLAAPANSKLTLEGSLGIVLDQGSQKLELTPNDIQFSINSTPMMILTSQRAQITPGRLLLSGDNSALFFRDTNRGIMYSKVPSGLQNFTNAGPKDGLALYGYLDGCLGTTDVANGGAKSILTWTSSGAVAINPITTTVNYPLAVYGYTNTPRGDSYIYMNAPATTGTGDFRASIYSQFGVVSGAYGFMTLSDERIKKKIALSTGALEVIDKINIVSYEHIDQMKEKEVRFGVVAQQLREYLPSAVRQTTDWIPNVYQPVVKQIAEGGTVHLFFAERVPSIIGKLLRLVGKKDILVRVLAHGTHSLVVDEYPVEGELFAYGTREDDFLVVDKQQLGVLALQGIKELMMEVQDLRRQLSEIKK